MVLDAYSSSSRVLLSHPAALHQDLVSERFDRFDLFVRICSHALVAVVVVSDGTQRIRRVFASSTLS